MGELVIFQDCLNCRERVNSMSAQRTHHEPGKPPKPIVAGRIAAGSDEL
jgi:hypothetical protein